MAFKDENGKITIDEIAAQNDRKSLLAAKEHVQTALQFIVRIEREAADLSGGAAAVITDTAKQLQTQLTQMSAALESASESIRQTVDKYRQIDEDLRNAAGGPER